MIFIFLFLVVFLGIILFFNYRLSKKFLKIVLKKLEYMEE